jgi:hypothetical protein
MYLTNANASQFIAHHGADKITPKYLSFYTNHLCDRSHFRGGCIKGIDYVAYQLKLAIEHYIKMQPASFSGIMLGDSAGGGQ